MITLNSDHERMNDTIIQRNLTLTSHPQTFDDPPEKSVMKIVDDTTNRIINLMK